MAGKENVYLSGRRPRCGKASYLKPTRYSSGTWLHRGKSRRNVKTSLESSLLRVKKKCPWMSPHMATGTLTWMLLGSAMIIFWVGEDREVLYRIPTWHRVRGWPWVAIEFRGRSRYCSRGPWLFIWKLLWWKIWGVVDGRQNIFEIMGNHWFPHNYSW